MTLAPLPNPAAEELEALTRLWEASVRATHDFLAPADLDFFRTLVRRDALPGTELYVLRAPDGQFTAFAGIEGEHLEMLFVAPDHRGAGLGRQLVEHLVRTRNIRTVDVNEQNAQAAGFYARLGFRVVGRDALDASGRPYPILHLAR